MIWYIHAVIAQDLIRQRERDLTALIREREVRGWIPVHSDRPRFGRIRRPLARLAGAISTSAGRAALALDPHTTRG